MTRITKAVLLAAGRGTRMRELTNDLPKPMLPVRGKPVLQHIVEGLGMAEVTRFSPYRRLARGSGARVFRRRHQFGVRIRYATQVVQNGTGKVVELARDFTGAADHSSSATAIS